MSDEFGVKRLRNASTKVLKIPDTHTFPLCLPAAQDLQSRLYNITEQSVLSFLHGSQDYQDCLIIYTAFLFGQYLCWTHILREQAQFACFATEERSRTKKLVDLLGRVQTCLNTDRHGAGEEPFMLWKGQQMAIGELMSVSKADAEGKRELFCMGFAEFTRKWKVGEKADTNESKLLDSSDDEAFRGWFRYIERGIYEVARQRRDGNSTGLNRVRRLQHLLLELIDALDPDGASARESKSVSAAPHCECTRCQVAVPKGRSGNV